MSSSVSGGCVIELFSGPQTRFATALNSGPRKSAATSPPSPSASNPSTPQEETSLVPPIPSGSIMIKATTSMIVANTMHVEGGGEVEGGGGGDGKVGPSRMEEEVTMDVMSTRGVAASTLPPVGSLFAFTRYEEGGRMDASSGAAATQVGAETSPSCAAGNAGSGSVSGAGSGGGGSVDDDLISVEELLLLCKEAGVKVTLPSPPRVGGASGLSPSAAEIRFSVSSSSDGVIGKSPGEPVATVNPPSTSNSQEPPVSAGQSGTHTGGDVVDGSDTVKYGDGDARQEKKDEEAYLEGVSYVGDTIGDINSSNDDAGGDEGGEERHNLLMGLAQKLHYAGVRFRNQGQHTTAVALFETALEIRRRTLGDDHVDVAMTLHAIASARLDQGSHTEALELFEQSLDITQTLGSTHAMMIDGSLGGTTLEDDMRVGEVAGARIEGGGGAMLLSDMAHATLNDMARVLLDQGRHEEARDLFERSRKVREDGDMSYDISVIEEEEDYTPTVIVPAQVNFSERAVAAARLARLERIRASRWSRLTSLLRLTCRCWQ